MTLQFSRLGEYISPVINDQETLEATFHVIKTSQIYDCRIGVLSVDGTCRPFDVDANGFARSEAVVVVFLQKARDAKRIYTTLIHGKTNCDGFKEQGVTFPSCEAQKKLYSEVYKDTQISPLDVTFLEAHGTATKVGDPEELNALDAVFCTGRSAPLKIGSVKSNMGHSEAASGLCSVSKVLSFLLSSFLTFSSSTTEVPIEA